MCNVFNYQLGYPALSALSLSVSLFLVLSVCLSLCLLFYLFISRSVCLFLCLFVSLSLCVFVSFSISLPVAISLSVCLSLCLSLSYLRRQKKGDELNCEPEGDERNKVVKLITYSFHLVTVITLIQYLLEEAKKM